MEVLMMISLFRKKDPVCGMRQEKGKGFIDENTKNWFCSNSCKDEFDTRMKKAVKSTDKPSCCH